MTSVLIADDQALLRGTFRLLIDSDPGLITVGEAENGAEAVALARAERPDVVLMDIRMPVLDGVEATRQICAELDTRVLVLTMFDLDSHVFGALRAGASGFLLKDTPPAELLAAIRIVAAGDALLAPSVTRRLIAEFGRTPAPSRATLSGVTRREEDVLRLVGRGLSNAEISAELHLGVGTVKTHVSHLLGKLGARDRAQLVVLAYETGLITPNRPGSP
ncbi:response regulator transcription factor [Kutzneria buriramensis]|uniref:DNA-binding NarL/FixJ family response regulator n=1 Tax=Kutzneria buriramensis TaxID=1045776 RepID=A0A3E0HAT4_9PSEU|nr:response regulator transcription factor [Kutzneria buriramensis]REH41157.1 DNA-binding NarL/FixJ family response regulator [Kutzneria buriramensis]